MKPPRQPFCLAVVDFAAGYATTNWLHKWQWPFFLCTARFIEQNLSSFKLWLYYIELWN
jgi:hypothetical protein